MRTKFSGDGLQSVFDFFSCESNYATPTFIFNTLGVALVYVSQRRQQATGGLRHLRASQ